MNAARDALQWFRREVKKAGFPGLELQLSMRGESDTSLKAWGTQQGLIAQLGFDSLTHYQFVHFVNAGPDYAEMVNAAERDWETISKAYKAKYYPHVSVGWDTSPRAERYTGGIIANNPPEAFEKALRRAKRFIDAHPDRAPLITINSWNEWTETSYLQPDDLYGYSYLEAVKRVFVERK